MTAMKHLSVIFVQQKLILKPELLLNMVTVLHLIYQRHRQKNPLKKKSYLA